MNPNIDKQVVADFGDEWQRYDQASAPHAELKRIFDDYFSRFPWEQLPRSAQGFDLGCGSGRWAYFAAQKVGKLHCIDPADAALAVAKRKLSGLSNCEFHLAGVDALPMPDGSMDFGYSLGVLHHVPDTARGVASCAAKLKPGAPFLLYLYYALDNRPFWFKAIWRATDVVRRVISRLPPTPKALTTSGIALLVYWPVSRLARVGEKLGLDVNAFPLATYRDKSFYTLRTDARDRFGTRLEQRFTKREIEEMMVAAGLERIQFRQGAPYWVAVGFRGSGGQQPQAMQGEPSAPPSQAVSESR